MSRYTLASEIGINEKQIRRIEKGESPISVITLLKLCFVLHIDLEFLKEYVRDETHLF